MQNKNLTTTSGIITAGTVMVGVVNVGTTLSSNSTTIAENTADIILLDTRLDTVEVSKTAQNSRLTAVELVNATQTTLMQ